jgi:hypothetical protein
LSPISDRRASRAACAAFAARMGTPEHLAAVAAFFQKRPPGSSNLG